jgi:hypothetical protein
VRDFTTGPGRLRVLSISSKLLYSAFLVAALVGLLVSWKLYGAAVGSAGPRAYYAGEAVAPPAAEVRAGSAESGGPSLDLPQETAVAKPMVEQISDRRLLEVTHFHIFTIPIYVLVLAHLFLLTRLPSWVHTTAIATAVGSSGMHIAGPWIVRGHPSLAFLMPVSAILMLFALGLIGIITAIDMWLPRSSRRTTESAAPMMPAAAPSPSPQEAE